MIEKYITKMIKGELVKIKYLEDDFTKSYPSLIKQYALSPDEVRTLVFVTDHNGEKMPVVDMHASEDYKEGAVTHEYLCTISQRLDEICGIRMGKNRCADAERLVLATFTGNRQVYIKQRKLMFQTVIKFKLNPNPQVIEKMQTALNMLQYLKSA